ncbi:nucleolar DEAD-box protein required for synthesis of 60S ribosomal subunit [Thoreauomyces humboldtii]|nr:nucleolar DEAD-box protein required for synthesis of 60S ribosomal subunit [Thoreauomyces humboldtii]
MTVATKKKPSKDQQKQEGSKQKKQQVARAKGALNQKKPPKAGAATASLTPNQALAATAKKAFDPLSIATLEDDDEAPVYDDDEDDEDEDDKPDAMDMDAEADFDDVALDHDPFKFALRTAVASSTIASPGDSDDEDDEELEGEDEALAHAEVGGSDDGEDVFGSDEEEDGDEDHVTVTKNRPTKQERGAKRAREEAEGSDAEEPEDIVHEKRKAEYFAEAPAPVETAEEESFTSMRLSRPILKGIAAMGFVKPTAIQARTIPIALQGTDICGSAVTGSGKTAAFMIPVLERLLFRPKNTATTRVLVLVPTRELGVQCHAVAMSLAHFAPDMQFCLCVGGLSGKTQEAELRKRPDVVIATPGRLIDHIHNARGFNLDSVEILIMDEADRMLEDGFNAELTEIIKHTPKTRQTMLFSATMTDNVDDLIKLSLNRPVRLFVDASNSIANRLTQEFIRVRGHREDSRPALLAALCTRTYKSHTIVFFRSKAAAHHMKVVFTLLSMRAAELHGNLTQAQRLEALEQFREQKVDFLLATDLASRGLDITGIRTVINYDMPKNYAQYVHRIGRTARGGAAGRAVSLVGEADRSVLKMAVKNSRDEVKHRIVPAPVVAKYETRIEALADDIKASYAEEARDREFKTADMQITRMQNMIEHEAEIKARPAKTWFLSGKEVAAEKEKGLARHNANFEEALAPGQKRKAEDEKPKRGAFDGLSRKQKRTKIAREEDSKELAAQARHARTAKQKARPTRMQQLNEPRDPSKAPANKPKRKPNGASFDSELVAGSKKKPVAAAATKKSSKPTVTTKDGKEKADRRLGKLRSNKSFKSSAKHKRR